jgi:hypothetical protein
MKQSITLVLGLALACSSTTARASAPASTGPSAPAAGGASASAAGAANAGASAPATAPAEPASVDAALASGDLAAARSQAEAASKADPGVATWAALAAVCERQADLECARTARARQRDAAPANSPERAEAAAKLAALEDMSRGTVEDEPASTHRAELDRARTSRELALRPAPQIDRPPGKAPPPRERIVKK